MRSEIESNTAFHNRDILIIGFCDPDAAKAGRAEDAEKACDLVGLIYSQNRCYERHAKAAMDEGGFWYLYFDENSRWEDCLSTAAE